MRTRALHRIQQLRNRNRKRLQRKKSEYHAKELELQRFKRRKKKVLDEIQQSQFHSLKEENKKLRNENIALKEQIIKLKDQLLLYGKVSGKKKSEVESQKQSPQQEQFHEMLVEKYLQHPDLSKLIGISKTQFNVPLSRCRSSFSQTTVLGTLRKYNRSTESRVSYRAHLYLTLCWLRHYPTMTKLSADFGLTNRRLTDILTRTLKILDDELEEEITWPSDEEFSDIISSLSMEVAQDFPDLGAIIDGTEVKIQRPNKQYEKLYYSKKKHQHSVTILLMCTPQGELIYASEPLQGSSDQHHFNKLNLRLQFVNKEYAIMGDSGFIFNLKGCPEDQLINAYTPIKKKPNQERSEEEKSYNRRLASVRVVVENVIARLKKWRILKGVYRHFSPSKNNQIPMELVVRVVLKLTAADLKRSPPRPAKWSPSSLK